MGRVLRLPTAKVFEPLLAPSRYKAAHGGRGSGKSHFFAEKLIEDCICEPGDYGEGLRAICIREVQKDLKESSKLLLETKLRHLGLNESDGFKVFLERIQTPGDGLIIFKGMQDFTADSIKSLEGFKRAWWEEAQTATAHSMSLLRPTIRVANSELWFSWNPRRRSDAVDTLFRGAERPTGTTVVQANWRDNPWWTQELEQERVDCLRINPEQYDHIWEGGYATVLEGAYYAKAIAEAKAQGRIGFVPADPLMTIRLYADIGGTGAKADAFTLWAVQFIGLEIRVIDYYEAVGQPLATHLAWCRERGYSKDKAQFWLPHDGSTQDKVYDVSYESALKSAGYKVTVVPNQGKGAAKQRIEAGRRLFPSCRFHEATTQPGLDALGWYHEHRDADRNIGLGPEHDWCLAAGTQVLTPNGWANVEDIRVHDEVLTPIGKRRIVRSGIVRMVSEWTSVSGVLCTPEHRFFTSRGLVNAGALSPQETLWTRDLWGLRILALLSAVFCLGLKTAITSETREGKLGSADQCSFIGWCMRLCMGRFRQSMKSIISMMTRSITTLKILLPYRDLSIAAATNQSRDTPAFAKSAGRNSAVTRHSASNAAQNANALHMLKSSESGGHGSKAAEPAASPAYNLTVAVDECYFVRGEDGLAYLVSNSSHGADAFGLMCVCHEPPTQQKMAPIKYRTTGIV